MKKIIITFSIFWSCFSSFGSGDQNLEPFPQLESPGCLISSCKGGVDIVSTEDFVAGYSFTVGEFDLSVLSLGFWDENKDGLSDSHDIGVWDESGVQLAQCDIPEGQASELIGDFRYEHLLGSTLLKANQTYTIGATVKAVPLDRILGSIQEIELGDGILAMGGALSVNSPSLIKPTNESQFGQYGYVGANMNYEVIPEPHSIGLLLLGCMCLKFIKKKS